MAVVKKTLFPENLERYNVFVEDTNPSSEYFKITELPDTFTGGKNAFLIAGSEYLVADTLLKIEIKDSQGNVVYHEPGEGIVSSSVGGTEIVTEYYEGISKVVAVHIYPDTSYGPATITILGELSSYNNNGLITPIPTQWEGQYNVKWQKQINVNPALANTTKIRFYQRPQASINEIISPIYRIENNLKVNTGINQSFANIKLSKLNTFAGDVKRVKVFRTSQGDISDYDLIQDILVESKELLTSYDLTDSVVGQTGIFTSEVLSNFWETTGSINTNSAIDRVESGIKLSGNGIFRYNQPLNLIAGNTYELNLDAFYSASTSSDLGIYISSGSISSSISILNGITPTKNLLDSTYQFKLDSDFISASLYFSQSQGEWHLGNVSLKLTEDTAFSPDEISFVTTMPTVVGNEDYNFKFEFYDVNNNYVPVIVTGSANFTGGSNTITKLLTFESDRTAFRFSTGSIANPASQFVKFKTQRTNFTGSITYSSASFDLNGNYIEPSTYAGTYPGALTNVSDSGALLSIANFSGSVSSVIVGSITYTASCEGYEEYETIYRFEDGENAPGIFVTSNTNQFIYKATDLSLNPLGQIITIEAKRKNLASATTPLTVNSGSGKPPLTYVSTNAANGVDTYTLAGSSYPYTTLETIYYISGSDQFGNEFSDSIKITPVKILDGLSVSLTNENATLPAKSTGFVESGSFVLTTGSVSVKVGNEDIGRNEGLSTNNRWDIISATATNCIANDTTPDDEKYSITRLDADSGSLSLVVRYKDGYGDTTDVTKVVTYSKAKKAAPILTISTTNKVQSVSAKSTGAQIDAFANATVTISENYNGSTNNLTITTLTATSSDIANISTTAASGLITLNGKTLANGTNSTTVAITAVVTDSEGTSRTLTDTISLSKVKKAVPVVLISATPQAQSVIADSNGVQTGTLSNVTISALEGTTSMFTSMTATYNGFSTNPTIATNSNILNTSAAVMNAADASATIVVTHTDSEGSTGQTQTIVVRFTKVPTGTKGDPGNDGDPGSPGADGKRTATGLVYYQLSAGSQPTKPQATLFTFNTAAFSGLTTNWDKGAPTFAAGNSNKYWYSTYTAVETTAGGGTAVPTFTDAVQAIGFTGLVTFTSTDNITDGTNTSEIVPKGSITNHIGGANVTTINGGRISTGIITSTGYTLPSPDTGAYTTNGTIFNLDNGALRSKNFYINSSGDAFFRGNITGASGTFGGSISIGSGDSIFKADSSGIYLGNATFASAPFSVTPAGLLKSTSGTIGGWTIGSTTLIGGNTTLDSAGNITLGTGNDVVRLSSTDGTYRIWVGNSTADSAPFRVTKGGAVTATNVSITGGSLSIGSGGTSISISSAGKLTAANVDVSGRVSATEGYIGDWVLTGPNLYASVGTKKLQLAAARPAMELYDNSSIVVDISANANLSDKSAGSINPSPSYINTAYTAANYEWYNQHYGSYYTYLDATEHLGPSSYFTISGGSALIGSTCTIGVQMSNSGTPQSFKASGDDSHGSNYLVRMDWNFSYGFKLTTPSNTYYVVYPDEYTNTLYQIGEFEQSMNYAVLLNTSVTLEAGTYTITPVVKDISATAVLSGTFGIGPATFQVYMQTPLVSNITAAVPVSKAELCAGGFQVVYDTSKYLEVKRANETDFVKIGGGLTVTGDVTANTSSDIKLKENLVRINNPLEKVSMINGYNYNWKEGFEHIHTNKGNDIGVIAQEIELVLPQLVTTRDNGFKAVRYDKIVALLIESIKELKSEIEELKKDK